ncbi:pentapeptide repeat-containing protein [Allokutzneria sp. A3M-2-11 16]|uniref:pentapeptide repeat-containing protein n=1 Tax=Allokutzneria sp. A3M-2-11 16 TaxID=2962043 RepID=UPI0020B7363E|nr:pentapeptide repeat-containing protein [Allokutzneria sp. A3M-2-11 16]MCP3800681.1 pentapeptide repeat-containing protein [Allokutzneria sp. A3M-2-11 16]
MSDQGASRRPVAAIVAMLAGLLLGGVVLPSVAGWFDWPAVGRWMHSHALLLTLAGASVVLLAVGAWSWWGQDRGNPPRRTQTAPLSWKVVAGAAIVIAVATWGATVWLLAEANTATDRASARVQAIKTGLGTGAGTVGIFALLLAVRRQQHQEITANDTTHDATQRRVTELYTKAIEQLGNSQAPVRLGGLYALERLAQHNSDQRQTIVNVLCAYLRMPYQPPATLTELPKDADQASVEKHDKQTTENLERTQEREVRLAAQRILHSHLQPGPEGIGAPDEAYWQDIDLDLSGAHLINFALTRSHVRSANFRSTTFAESTSFRLATFAGNLTFHSARFMNTATFNQATFNMGASFEAATFDSGANFRSSTFNSHVNFKRLEARGRVGFILTRFVGSVQFTYSEFLGVVDFEQANFAVASIFQAVTFKKDANFSMVEFADDANFDRSTFDDTATFHAARFDDDASFASTTFTGKKFNPLEQDLPHTDFRKAVFKQGIPEEIKPFLSP